MKTTTTTTKKHNKIHCQFEGKNFLSNQTIVACLYQPIEETFTFLCRELREVCSQSKTKRFCQLCDKRRFSSQLCVYRVTDALGKFGEHTRNWYSLYIFGQRNLLRHIYRRISEDQKGRNILNQTVTILTSQASANAFVSDAAFGEQWKTWQTNTSGAVLTM